MSTRRPHVASRLEGLGTTVFATMSALAAEHDAVNLGQGFPDDGTPPALLDLAREAIAQGHNQYAPGRGVPALRAAVAHHQRRHHGLDVDPDGEVLVTAGATEGMAAALLALCEPGDDVLALEPTYDVYRAMAQVAGARLVGVPLHRDEGRWRLDPDRLASAVTPRTRVLVVNTPHNPTGHVLTGEERAGVARVAQRHDLTVVTDEVYEHLAYDEPHVPLATDEALAGCTLTISSAGKSFAVTGWKVGWAVGPRPLVDAVASAKQWLTFVNGTPFQHALAAYLDDDGGRTADAHLAALRSTFRSRRDRLSAGLFAAGLAPLHAAGGYFVVADAAPVGVADGLEACLALPGRVGVAAIPVQVFCTDPSSTRTLLRFAFCKTDATIDAAIDRLAALRPPG